MSKIRIENPKVFISYAWSSKEYENKVLSFANDLVEDGIDVILDKWSLKEGNDTYAFMEQSVNDQTVTNVLLMLDPQYEKKANDRTGGVGTETQIISSEIYNQVKQEKFLPIVFERNEDGSIPKPTYIKGLLHFDLSLEEKYEEEYQRLVKTLYGIEIFKKPELGKKPAWLEETVTVSRKTRTSFEVLKTNLPEKVKTEKFDFFLSKIEKKIIDYNERETVDGYSLEEYLELYSETIPIRNEFLNLVKNVLYIEGGEKSVASKLEEICSELKLKNGYVAELCRTLLHEIFIYVIVIYYKARNYAALSYTLSKTYFVQNGYGNGEKSFNVFYHYDQTLDNAINQQDNKKYYSGTANFWIKNINTEVCTKNEFVFADTLCYNASVFNANYLDSNYYWFPLTYIYDGNNNRIIRNFANKLKSMEHLSESMQIFGYTNVEQFKKKFMEIEDLYLKGDMREYRHSGCFESAPLLCQYIKGTDLGILK